VRRRALVVALIAVSSSAVVLVQQQPVDNQPGRTWSEEQLQKAVNHVRAGRKLTPKTWPDGARVAAALTFTVNNTVGSLSAGDDAIVQVTGGEFGALVGLPRVLAMLDAHDVPATFFIPAMSAIVDPGMIAEILKRKRHEIGVMGWGEENVLSPAGAADEGRLLTRAFDHLKKATGKRPVGARGPMMQQSVNTVGLLKNAGVLYDSTLMAMDEPYEILLDGQPSGLVELPVSRYLDDQSTLTAPRFGPSALPSPDLVFETFRDEFDVAYEEGTMFLVSLHPHIIGMRSRIDHLDDLVRYIKAKPNVWFATGEQIARYVKTQAGMAVSERRGQ
jgi:peptidoglycan/xylan/chitin deacetylase (PgdA/CDA1 family)